jgi:hypothetical protein
MTDASTVSWSKVNVNLQKNPMPRVIRQKRMASPRRNTSSCGAKSDDASWESFAISGWLESNSPVKWRCRKRGGLDLSEISAEMQRKFVS